MHLSLVIPILFHVAPIPSSYLTYYSRRSSPSLLSSSPAHFFRSSSQVMSCSSSLSSLYPTFCSSHHLTSSSSSISSSSTSFLLQYVLAGFFLPSLEFSHRLHRLSLLFLKEYVGMAAEVEGLESTVVGGDSSTKRRSLP